MGRSEVQLWELVARESIRDVIARYNAQGDSARWDEVLPLFAPDAVMDLGDGRVYEGREAILGMFTDTAASFTRSGGGRRFHLRHFTATTQIDVLDEGHARARSYFLVLAVHGLDHWGRYIDTFGQVDGSWCFTRREVRLDACYEGSWAASIPVNADLVVRGLTFGSQKMGK